MTELTDRETAARRTPTTLHTARLLLRPFAPSDAGAVLRACQDPLIVRWTQVPTPYTAQHAEDFVSTVSTTAWATGTDALFAVVDRQDGELLASVGLHFARGRDEREGEVGFWCVPAARGRGVVAEAIAAIARWGFADCGLERLAWLAGVGNHASWRAAEKAGFHREGTLRGYLLHRGERVDAWVGSLLPADLDTPAAG